MELGPLPVKVAGSGSVLAQIQLVYLVFTAKYL